MIVCIAWVALVAWIVKNRIGNVSQTPQRKQIPGSRINKYNAPSDPSLLCTILSMLHVTQRVYTTYLLVLGDGGRSGGVGNVVVHVEFDEQCVVQITVRFGILFVFAVPPQHPQFVVPVREHLMPQPRPDKEWK